MDEWTILTVVGSAMALGLGAIEWHLRRSRRAERNRGFRRKERFQLFSTPTDGGA